MSIFDIEVLALLVHLNMPIHDQLVALGTTTASAIQRMTWRRIEREGEQVLRFDKIRHQAVTEKKKPQAEDWVHF